MNQLAFGCLPSPWPPCAHSQWPKLSGSSEFPKRGGSNCQGQWRRTGCARMLWGASAQHSVACLRGKHKPAGVCFSLSSSSPSSSFLHSLPNLSSCFHSFSTSATISLYPHESPQFWAIAWREKKRVSRSVMGSIPGERILSTRQGTHFLMNMSLFRSRNPRWQTYRDPSYMVIGLRLTSVQTTCNPVCKHWVSLCLSVSGVVCEARVYHSSSG